MAKKKVTVKTKKGKKGAKQAASKAAQKPKGLHLSELPEDIAERAQEIWMAGLGALSTVQEEGGKVFSDLVKKGQAWEKERAKDLKVAKEKIDAALGEVAERGKDAGGGLATRLGKIEDSLEALLGRLNTAVRDEVKQVSGRVDALTKRVETLAGDLKAGASVREAISRAVVTVTTHSEGGWEVAASGSDKNAEVLPNKKEAVKAARALAQELAPSQLVIYRQDGTVQDTVTYGEL